VLVKKLLEGATLFILFTVLKKKMDSFIRKVGISFPSVPGCALTASKSKLYILISTLVMFVRPFYCINKYRSKIKN